MRHLRVPILAVILASAIAFTIPAASAQAPTPPSYTLKAMIPIPTWDDLTTISVDISWLDSETQTYMLADRSPISGSGGGAIEVIDAASYAFTRAAALGRFVGVGPTGTGGPNGVVSVGPNEAAAGDGDSTLKIVNLLTNAVQSISTGGTLRVDEMGYDPATDILIAANDRSEPPFLTLFKVHPLSIIGQIPYPQATRGIEQPLLANGKFWVTIPATVANPGGEIDLIDPATMSVEVIVPAGDCRPTGLAHGVNGTLITGGGGCVIDPVTRSINKILGAGGDEVASDPSRGLYAYTIGDTQSLNLADGNTNLVYQRLAIGGGRNLAINPRNGEIFVPDITNKMVLVFAPVDSM